VDNVCQEPNPCAGGFDLGLLIQSSSKSQESEFERLKNGIAEIIGRLNVNKDQVHVGILPISQRTRAFSTLKSNDQLTSRATADRIRDLSFVPYVFSPLDIGLKTSLTQLFNTDRSYPVPKVAVLFNDARSNPKIDLTPYAQEFKSKSIEVIAVGLGSDVDLNELRTIASQPDYVFQLSSIDQFFQKLDKITQKICSMNADIRLRETKFIKMGKNDLRYYKTSLAGVTSEYLEIEFTEIKGTVDLYVSFEIKNPFSQSSLVQSRRLDEAMLRNSPRLMITEFLEIPPNAKEVYFTLQSFNLNSEVELAVRELEFK
jgi:hypothetical protein